MDTIHGTDQSDILVGTSAGEFILGWGGDDTIEGLGGNDNLQGQTGDDKIFGGDGDDFLYGGPGADFMDGGGGNDTFFVDDAGDIVVDGGEGIDWVNATVTYTIADPDIEILRLWGEAPIDGTGNKASNTVVGNHAANVLSGGNGDDTLIGNYGDDTLNGGRGADILKGGGDGDRFDFNSTKDSHPRAFDIIRGDAYFAAFDNPARGTGDVIDLKGIDADETVAGNQAFILGGTGTGGLSIVDDGEDTVILGNVDGDGAFEFMLVIEDGPGVTASQYDAGDFVL